jgi:hypothetical protein
MTGVILGLIGISVAIGIPLGVEWCRRPKLRIDRADDVNQRGAESAWRLVHIKMVNVPLRGLLSRFLLRNPATSCRVTVTFKSRSDGKQIEMSGRWTASPEPRSLIGGPPEVPMEDYKLDPIRAGMPSIGMPFDPTKVPQTLRFDLSADAEGEPIPIAIKFNGDAAAYGFTSESYAYSDFRKPELVLPDEEYTVTVDARAGGIKQRRKFCLHNAGQLEADLRLEPLD